MRRLVAKYPGGYEEFERQERELEKRQAEAAVGDEAGSAQGVQVQMQV